LKWLRLSALLICVIVAASGIGHYLLIPQDLKPPPIEKKPGLRVSLVLNATSVMFPEALNVTSTIQNANGRSIDSLEILQWIPTGFNVSDAYLLNPDRARSLHRPALTTEGLKYSLTTPLKPKENLTITAVLQSTLTSASGNFTTTAKGFYDGKEVHASASSKIDVHPFPEIEFVQGLMQQNRTWAVDVVKRRICLEDGKLTDLERNFLNNPTAYGKQLLNWYIVQLESNSSYAIVAREFRRMPELSFALHGLRPTSIDMVEAVEDVVYLALLAKNPEVKEAFDLMIGGGTPDPRDFTYSVPSWNTELQVLYWLACQNEFKKDDTLVLSIAMVHGLWVTMGDEEVRQAVRKDTSDLLVFLRWANELQKERGYYQLEDYPLEAKVSLSHRSYLTLLMGPYALFRDPTFLAEYQVLDVKTGRIKVFPLIGYRWGTVSIDTLREMQKEMDSKGWITRDVGETISRVENYLYFSGRSGRKGEHWYYVADFSTPEKSRFITIDGLNVSIGNINNVNWQFSYFLKNDQGIGGCTDEAALVDGFAKSWGIATTGHFRMNKLPGPTRRTEFTAHTYVTYFDPATHSWKAFRKQLTIDIDKEWIPKDSIAFLGVLKPPVKQIGYVRGWNEDVFFVGNMFYMIRNTSLNEIAGTWTNGVATSQMKQWLLYS